VKSKKNVVIILGVLAAMLAGLGAVTGSALADPQHCDSPGWPSCYSVGHNVGNADGTQAVALDLPFDDSCPSGHSANFSSGYTNGYDAAYNANGQSQTISGGPCSTCSGSSTSGGGTSGHTPEYRQGFRDGKTDALNSGIYDVGSSCGGYTSKECSHYIQGYHDGYEAACASSKFIDACSGDAPGTLKQ
jgi:hypothetical protein